MSHTPRHRSASGCSQTDHEQSPRHEQSPSRNFGVDGTSGTEGHVCDGEKQPDALRDALEQMQVSDTDDCDRELFMGRLDTLIEFDTLRVLERAPDIPLVNKESLSELDLPVIQNNLSLRSDLPYDFELYFQPVTGLKGTEKLHQANAYWSSIILALHVISLQFRASYEIPPWLLDINFGSRIQRMLKTLKELIEMLVPDSDKAEVQEYFDVEWQLQRISFGSFDMEKFSTWIIGLLMQHCAPMRDELAGEIKDELQEGALTGNLKILVQGIEKLFSLLEAMKLDVANHQIRTFVKILVEDVVPFQRDCFQKMIASKQLDLKSSTEWFDGVKSEFLRYHQPTVVLFPTFECAVFGLSMLCKPGLRPIPSFYQHDAQRIQKLRDEVSNLAVLNGCLNLYKERCAGKTLDELEARCDKLTERLVQLMGEDDVYIGSWIKMNVEAVGTEIARFASTTSANKSELQSQDCLHGTNDIQATIDKLQKRLFVESDSQNMVEAVCRQLFSRALDYTKEFSNYSTLQLSNLQRQYGLQRSEDAMKNAAPEIEDMSRRVAHVAILHWRVWHDKFYSSGVHPFGVRTGAFSTASIQGIDTRVATKSSK